MAERQRIKDQWGEQRSFEQRAVVAGGIIVFLTGALLARLVWLQIVQREYYTELSQGNRVRIEAIPANRGVIYDRNGKILVENRPAYQLELLRDEVPNLEGTLARLVQIGLLAPDELDATRRLIRGRRGFDSVPIRLRLTEEQIARFALHRFDFPGVDIKTRLARSYPFGELAVHALGYVAAISESDLEHIDRAEYAGTTLIGKLGIEAQYEQTLHGRNGTREILVNAKGRSMQKQGALIPELRSIAPVAGTDVVLSIDLDVQRVAEQAVSDKRAAVIAIDPRSGDILAMVSRPGFDPNAFGRGLTHPEFDALNNNLDRPLLNRALRGAYPPGSTVKPFVALAGLTSGVILPEETRYCRGFYTLPGSSRRFREGKTGVHGSVDMVRAIGKSCDVYFYALATAIGPSRIANFLGHFGFGKLTGVDIGGEKSGLLPSPDWKRKAYAKPADQIWYPGETVIFGIGQGYMQATPIQLAHAAAVIGSRGKSFQPRLLKALRNPVTGKLTELRPKFIEQLQVASAENWQVAIDGMYNATHGGTATAAAAGAEYTIAGKTGTAQVFSVAQNEKYDAKKVAERLRDHAWFIGFAPVDNPRIAVAVLVENGGFGAAAAAPVARQVMDAYLLRKFPPPAAVVTTPSTSAPEGPE